MTAKSNLQTCPECDLDLSPAEFFLHAEVHCSPVGSPLSRLPFSLMPEIARVMEAYAEKHASREKSAPAMKFSVDP